MNKHIAFAYAITGLAVAVAAVTTIGSSYGLLGKDAERGTAAAEQAPAAAEATPRMVEGEPPPQAPPLPVGSATDAPPTAPTPFERAEQPVEVVYVDEPAQRREDDDDDDDDDRREHHERKSHDKRKRHDKHQEHDDDDD